jgi:OmpA-OmpF porin, OOP family
VAWDSGLTSFPGNGKEVPQPSWSKANKVIVPLPATALFKADQAVLRPGSGHDLDEMVTLLTKTHPTATADIAGHTATVPGGSDAAALALWRARAQTVARYLQAHGVAASRLSTVGHGGEDPAASNTRLFLS